METAQGFIDAIEQSLIRGQLGEMRRYIRRAERFALSDLQIHTLRAQAIRLSLLTGQYSQADVIRRAQKSDDVSPDSEALRQALFSVADWAEPPSSLPEASFYSHVSALSDESAALPEIPLAALGQWGHFLEVQPSMLLGIAAEPFPIGICERLGERLLPPAAEAALAELWHFHHPGGYPRAFLLEEPALEVSFLPVRIYLAVLDSLKSGDIPAVRAALDDLFEADGLWLWQRMLGFLSHYGTPEQVRRSPLRLRMALRSWGEILPAELAATVNDYNTLTAAFIETVIASLPEETVSQETGSLRTELAKVRARIEIHGRTTPVGVWASAPGACLLERRLLADTLESDLPESLRMYLASPVLASSHTFLHALRVANPERVVTLWLTLSGPQQKDPAAITAVQEALPQVELAETVSSCVAALLSYGCTHAEVLRMLTPAAQIAVFLKSPGPDNLPIMLTLPEGAWRENWLAVAEAGVSVLEGFSSETAVLYSSAFWGRLSSTTELPEPDTPLDAAKLVGLAEASSKIKDAVVRGQVLDWIIPRLCLQGETQVGLRLARQSTLTGESSALLWLMTGDKACGAPDTWGEPLGQWGEAAWAWHCLLRLTPAHLPETSSVRGLAPDLAAAFDALSAWSESCISRAELVPFPEAALVKEMATTWRFPLGLRSWRMLTPAAGILTTITSGHVPSQEAPLIALARVGAHGPDVSSMQVILGALLGDEERWGAGLAILAFLETDFPLLAEPVIEGLDDLLTPELLLSLHASLSPVQRESWASTLKRIGLARLSPAGKALLKLDLANVSAKSFREASLSVTGKDLLIEDIWHKMEEFLDSRSFCAWSLPQWEIVQDWRVKIKPQQKEIEKRVLEAVAPSLRERLTPLFFDPLRPALIDGSNMVRDAAVTSRLSDPFDFLESLCACLAASGRYPVLAYVDTDEYRRYDLQVKEHLNSLLREGRIESHSGYRGDERTSDYRILREITRHDWQYSAMIVTNDDYAKDPRDGGWGDKFSWLNRYQFKDLQALMKPSPSGGWIIVMPDGKKELTF